MEGPKWENEYTMKAVLHLFELVSGVKVNFYKSRLIGINIPLKLEK